MFPWYWIWAPQMHWPFSGAVAQDIEPRTDWFFNGIPSQAGDAHIEKQAFDIASYGRQLGWITELLLDIASQQTALSDEGSRALSRLRDAHDKIERLKAAPGLNAPEDIARQLATLKTQDPQAFEQLWSRLSHIFGSPQLPA